MYVLNGKPARELFKMVSCWALNGKPRHGFQVLVGELFAAAVFLLGELFAAAVFLLVAFFFFSFFAGLGFLEEASGIFLAR